MENKYQKISKVCKSRYFKLVWWLPFSGGTYFLIGQKAVRTDQAKNPDTALRQAKNCPNFFPLLILLHKKFRPTLFRLTSAAPHLLKN
ncbi:MAG: hypothetical protein ACRCVT_03945, partial [Leadbetterella sp.]